MVELLTVLAVIGVILAITVPNFRSFVLNSRMTGSANDLLASIQLARSEAIKRQLPVALCASANPEATPPDCADQFTGWTVWVDTDDDAVVDNGEAIIDSHTPLNASLTLISDGDGFFSYGPDGFARDSVAGDDATRLVVICDERGNQQIGDSYRKRVVALNPAGRPAILKISTEVDVAEQDALGGTNNCPEA